MRAFILDMKLHETEDPQEIRDAYAARKPLWLDLSDRTPEAEALLAETFRLHPLCIEDIWSDATLPKIEDFGNYLYVLANGVETKPGSAVSVLELDMVVGTHFLISHHTGRMLAVDNVTDDLRRNPRLLSKGPAWVLHSLLDHLIDHFSPLMDSFDDQLDELERDVIEYAGLPEGRGLLPKIFGLKRSLMSLRRTAVYQRDMLLRLSRGEFECIPQETLPFFRDVYDHFARTSDLADSYRDLVTSALDAYLSVQSNRMNEVMKALTLISTVMLPLTFIAGVYGMNFEFMPELHWKHGYAFALILMGTVAVGIVLLFRRKRWL